MSDRHVPSKTESLADLLREARRDWITDTEWVGDHYGGVMQPRGEAVRAFGARIDAALQGETPADSGIPGVEWLAMLARDDKYASVEHCDVPIQDRRSLIAAVKRLTSRSSVKTGADPP